MSDSAVISCSLIFAFILVLLAVIFTVINRKNVKKVLRLLGVFVFLMLICVLYPYALKVDTSYALGLTLAESMCAMLLNSSPSEILAGYDAYNVAYIGLYKRIVLCLLIVAPLFTISITLSFFSEKFARFFYRISSTFKDSYLFSDINERSIAVAEDIYKNDKNVLIVFAIHVSEDDISIDHISRIKKIKAHIINEDVVMIKHSLRRTRNYYLLSSNGNNNLEQGVRLYKKYNENQTNKVNMWLYTRGEVSEAVFDHLYETFNVRLINEESLVAGNLISDFPLFNAISDNRLSVLVVGAGYIGLEIIKLVSVCSRMGKDLKVEINVIDLDAENAKSKLEKSSPGLIEMCGINFFSANVNTDSFPKVLDQLSPTYIVVSLGNQNINLETALYIRRRYGIKDSLPRIHAIVDDKRIRDEILPSLNVSDWSFNKELMRYESTFRCSFDIIPFGSYEETYSNLRIGASYKDCLAVAVTAQHRGITVLDDENTIDRLFDLYNQVAYYKDYSDLFAISVPYMLYSLGYYLVADGEGYLGDLSETIASRIETFRECENARYEAFMRSKGWRLLLPSELDADLHLIDKLCKKHARMTTENQRVLEDLTGKNFDVKDEKALLNIPQIIKLANQLSKKGYSVRKI